MSQRSTGAIRSSRSAAHRTNTRAGRARGSFHSPLTIQRAVAQEIRPRMVGVELARDALVRLAAERHAPQHPRVLDRDFQRLAGRRCWCSAAVRRT